MTTFSDLTVPEWSKQQLLDLFSTSEVQPSQWCTVIPKGENSFEHTPSNSDTYYTLISGCDETAKKCLHDSFKKVFDEQAHVGTFWEEFSLNVTHKLGLTYKEVQKLNGMKLYSEAKLQQSILNPILKEVSGTICIIPNVKGEMLKADFLIEGEIVLVQDEKRGHRPTVDAVIQFSNKDDKVRAFVPIEMKLNLDTKQYSQIACYMNKVSTAEDIRGYIMVGILIDKKQFRLAFSMFHSGAVPLPIVHISPPLQWRSEPESIISEESMLTLACTFLIGRVERIEYDPEEHLQDVTISPKKLIELGEFLLQNPHTFQRPIHESVVSLLWKVKEQQKVLNIIQEIIEEQKKEIKELKELKKQVISMEKSIELQESQAGEPKRKIPKKYW